MSAPPVVLAVAGTDSGGAAGLAADLVTCAALGAHGACAVTAVTAQDTTGVHRVHRVPVEHVRAQVAAVLGDLPVTAVKTGMLGSAETAAMVAAVVAGLPHRIPLVVDPVLVASSGAVLGDPEVAAAYREVLLPVATVTTPNREEAAALTGLDRGLPAERLAAAVHALGPAVVLTGGDPDATICRDLVVDQGGATVALEHPTVPTGNDHGTGCTYSTALAVGLARGQSLPVAARRAQRFVAAALATSRSWTVGAGRGPVAHTLPPPTPGHHPSSRS